MNTKCAVITLMFSTLIFVSIAGAQTKKIPRLGWLSVGYGPGVNPNFRQAMRELGWFHGENITVETRFAHERYDQLPKLAAELVQLRVDVIAAADSVVIPAAKNATNTIPIVMVVSRDPVSEGYVASLARPGGNITGLTNDLRPISGKRLQILKESVPSVSRVGIIFPRLDVDSKKLETTSRSLGVEPLVVRFEDPDRLDSILNTARTQRINGLMVLSGSQTNRHRTKIITFASQYRLPAMYSLSDYVADGGLMSYGPNLPAMYRRAAYYVDKILKGAKPSDLPVERPVTAEFAINLKAAKAIRIKIPPEVLQRADRVIR
jgi:putative tryptophan/tyrosine transport system substrate-binding protein